MDTKPQKSGRKMRILLGVSLALNLLVVGALVGAGLNRGGGGERGGPKSARGSEAAIGIYGRALDKADRKVVGQAIRNEGRAQGKALRAELRGLAQEAVAVLRTENFEPDAFREIMSRQQGLIKSRADDAQMALADHVAAMSLDARMEYADRLEAAMTRGPRARPKKQN